MSRPVCEPWRNCVGRQLAMLMNEAHQLCKEVLDIIMGNYIIILPAAARLALSSLAWTHHQAALVSPDAACDAQHLLGFQDWVEVMVHTAKHQSGHLGTVWREIGQHLLKVLIQGIDGDPRALAPKQQLACANPRFNTVWILVLGL